MYLKRYILFYEQAVYEKGCKNGKKVLFSLVGKAIWALHFNGKVGGSLFHKQR